MEKTQIVEAGKLLADKGLVVRSWGNISLRKGREEMYITPSGISYERLEEEDIVYGDIYGNYGGGIVSSEHALHEQLYQADEDLLAIVHTHQPLAGALGATAIEEIEGLDVSFVPYRPAGSEDLARGAVEAARQADTIILRNHGCVLLGRGEDAKSALADAVQKADRLEQASEAVIRSVGLGDLIEKQDFLPPKLGFKDLDMILDRIFYWNKGPVIEEIIKQDREKLFARTDDFAQIGGIYLYIDPERGIGNSSQQVKDIEAAVAITNKNALACLLSDSLGGELIEEEEAKRLRQNYIDVYCKRDKQDQKSPLS